MIKDPKKVIANNLGRLVEAQDILILSYLYNEMSLFSSISPYTRQPHNHGMPLKIHGEVE